MFTYWLDTTKRLSFKSYLMGSLLMNRVNYDAMSNAELKQYFLKHRGNQAALQAYLDRINQRPLRIIASPSDPDFDDKIQAAIRQKLEAARNSSHQQTPDSGY
jgi:hypothetical protein